ncbi:hypothetical protein BJV78DRAFT_1282218 [Lactifluus subvellereus]|nr:hypothetical protein BJV78DRAFT_1282218 [Lactifluus subvellereus]
MAQKYFSLTKELAAAATTCTIPNRGLQQPAIPYAFRAAFMTYLLPKTPSSRLPPRFPRPRVQKSPSPITDVTIVNDAFGRIFRPGSQTEATQPLSTHSSAMLIDMHLRSQEAPRPSARHSSTRSPSHRHPRL